MDIPDIDGSTCTVFLVWLVFGLKKSEAFSCMHNCSLTLHTMCMMNPVSLSDKAPCVRWDPPIAKVDSYPLTLLQTLTAFMTSWIPYQCMWEGMWCTHLPISTHITSVAHTSTCIHVHANIHIIVNVMCMCICHMWIIAKVCIIYSTYTVHVYDIIICMFQLP